MIDREHPPRHINIKYGEYRFRLIFENGEVNEADLKALIGDYVAPESLNTAHLDTTWGCLEFEDGKVDIDPKTLYAYVNQHAANITAL